MAPSLLSRARAGLKPGGGDAGMREMRRGRDDGSIVRENARKWLMLKVKWKAGSRKRDIGDDDSGWQKSTCVDM